MTPHLPEGWPGYRIDYRHGDTQYRIDVVRGETGTRGAPATSRIPLSDDGGVKHVRVEAGGD